MRILALCFYNNYWPDHEVRLIDKRLGGDVMSLPDTFGRDYDLIISAPPCNQFTKANSRNWLEDPEETIIALKCLTISLQSGKPWILENVPGRIEKLIPELSQYRVARWQSANTYKSHILYSNTLVLVPTNRGQGQKVENIKKKDRDKWQSDLVHDINYIINIMHNKQKNSNQDEKRN